MREQKTNLTPAAVVALAKGDLHNFEVAATPGGIEAQEAAGQVMLCASNILPRQKHSDERKKLDAMGVKFGANVDDLFVTVTLPPGWTKQATDHSMWSHLLDDKSRVRAMIFYKAAFYDRSADLQLKRRYGIETFNNCDAQGNPVEDRNSAYRSVTVTDCGKSIHVVGIWQSRDYEASRALEKQAQAWLNERFPNWEDETAYWD